MGKKCGGCSGSGLGLGEGEGHRVIVEIDKNHMGGLYKSWGSIPATQNFNLTLGFFISARRSFGGRRCAGGPNPFLSFAPTVMGVTWSEAQWQINQIQLLCSII